MGDRVVVSGYQKIGIVEWGATVASWKDQGHERPGCYAEYNVLEAYNLLPIPADTSPQAMAPLELAMCVQVSFIDLKRTVGLEGRRIGVRVKGSHQGLFSAPGELTLDVRRGGAWRAKDS